MADFSVGDLVVCVRTGMVRCACGDEHYGAGNPKDRAAREVVHIGTSGEHYGDECPCLVLYLSDGAQGLAVRFRKIRPDEHEACEPEFVTLLRGIRHKKTREHVTQLRNFYGW